MAERLYVTPRMREVAPYQCKQIDALRKYRRFALNRHIYCKNRCKEVEAAEVLQSIAAIDDQIPSINVHQLVETPTSNIYT